MCRLHYLAFQFADSQQAHAVELISYNVPRSIWRHFAASSSVRCHNDVMFLLSSKQAHGVETTSVDVDATSSRRISVSTTSFPRCVPVGLKQNFEMNYVVS